MSKTITAALAAALLTTTVAAAHADTFTQSPSFIPSYTGPRNGDLEVTSLSASYDSLASDFLVSGTVNGAFGTTAGAQYVLGVDTGTGKIAPFGKIGEGAVKFDQVVTFKADGSVTGAAGSDLAITGDSFHLIIPKADLASTGFAANEYGVNLWPEDGKGLSAIADFAPNDALLKASAVSAAPEPATWMLLFAGVGLMGFTLRQRRTQQAAA